MTWKVLPAFVGVGYGSSLSTGRLSTFWMEALQIELMQCPEAVGPIILHNKGKGSQNSDWGLANAKYIADINPDFILTEGFGINSSAVSGGIPQVTLGQHISNMQGMHDIWKARNPNVEIQWQTMNPVSSVGDGLRPNLSGYYAAEITKALQMGDRVLDNYANPPVPPGQPGGWIKPLPLEFTQDLDGLHPTKLATDMYLKPNAKLVFRQAMARHWGLPEPTV